MTSKDKGTTRAAQKKRLWIITELYHPENNQTGYYLTGIGEGLTRDFDVKVICSQPNYASKGTVAPKHEWHNGVEIFRVRGTTLDKDVIPLRLINMLTNGVSVVAAALSKIRPGDEVLTVSAPPSLPFATAFASRIRRTPYSVIIQDKYPEHLVALKKLRPESSLARTLTRFTRGLYARARRIIVVGRDMQELVRTQTPADRHDRIAFVPNWAALEEVEPRPRSENRLLDELGLADKFVFLYAGNMGHPQDVESIIECAERLRDHPAIRFIFIGSGVKRKWVEAAIKERELTNVTLLDPLPRERQTEFLNACDVGFVSLVREMYGLAMPSRTYNLLAAGKPILALTEPGSEVDRVIREEGVGWSVPPQDADSLCATILEIYVRRDELPRMGDAARAAALSKYSPEVAIDGYRRAMAESEEEDRLT